MKYNVSFIEDRLTETEKVECDQIYIDNGILVCMDDNEQNLIAAFTTWIKVLPVEK